MQNVQTEKKSIARTALTVLLIWIVVLAAAIIVSTGLMTAIYHLPTGPIDESVAASAPLMEREGTAPVITPYAQSQLDNWTDSIMLLGAADANPDTALQNAMLNHRGYIKGEPDPRATLVRHYIGGEAFSVESAYARYWHGYLVILKPLLSLMDYHALRILNGVVQIALIAWLLFLLFKNKEREMAFAWLLVWFMLMPLALMRSLQYSNCFYVMMAGSLAAVLLRGRMTPQRMRVMFLLLGILTAFSDLLTYPAATFGVPMVLALVLSADRTMRGRVMQVVRGGMSWCAGYAGMWAGKWLVAGLITGTNVRANAVGAIAVRASSYTEDGTGHISHLRTIAKNVFYFVKTPAVILLIAFAVVLLIRWKKGAADPRSKGAGRGGLVPLLPYLIVAAIPFAWYLVTNNHASIHAPFTNKALAVTAFAVLAALAEAARSTGRNEQGDVVRREQSAAPAVGGAGREKQGGGA